MKLDLNNIIAYFNNLNEQLRYGLLGLAVLLVIVLDVFFLVLPQIGGIADVNSQIKKMSEDIQKVHTDKERIEQLRKNLKDTHAQLNALSARVRSLQEVPAILSTISNIANQYSVKIDQLVPEKSMQETLTSDADGKYYALPILIRAHCGYHMFGRFLNDLENEDLYFILKDFIIQNDVKEPATHSFSLTIRVILVDRTTKNI
jgi:Tfp pilus assembly protein PilO